jgi:hypothetical protein
LKENKIITIFQTLFICYNNQVKEDGVGVAYSPNGGKDKCAQVIGGKARGKETTRKTKT